MARGGPGAAAAPRNACSLPAANPAPAAAEHAPRVCRTEADPGGPPPALCASLQSHSACVEEDRLRTAGVVYWPRAQDCVLYELQAGICHRGPNGVQVLPWLEPEAWPGRLPLRCG